MSKVTSKLQVTLPKAIARQYGIQPGDEIIFQPLGDQLRVISKAQPAQPARTTEQRLRLFDEATTRQRAREAACSSASSPADRGWSREDLYRRGFAG
ncbi:AbrB/MazE/SpoVT family DNA-binding domain-containing protein [bacterium]|nr:AbrB/MazE/SpoVT family DNA-binding domain-containing protein [bacterium]